MGDALDASEQAMYNFDTLAMHTAFMLSVAENQGPGGDVPVAIPGGSPKEVGNAWGCDRSTSSSLENCRGHLFTHSSARLTNGLSLTYLLAAAHSLTHKIACSLAL